MEASGLEQKMGEVGAGGGEQKEGFLLHIPYSQKGESGINEIQK